MQLAFCRIKIYPYLNLNKYSWSILVAFICAACAMLSRTANVSLQDFVQTVPLIIIAVYYCETLAPLINRPDDSRKKAKAFTRDLFIISFSFLFAGLLCLLLPYNTSDVNGWWPLMIYFITLYGVFFSVFFSAIALLMENHKTYTLIFSFLIIVFVPAGQFFPHPPLISYFGHGDTFYRITGSLLILHGLFAVNYKLFRLFQCKKYSVY